MILGHKCSFPKIKGTSTVLGDTNEKVSSSLGAIYKHPQTLKRDAWGSPVFPLFWKTTKYVTAIALPGANPPHYPGLMQLRDSKKEG